MKETGTTTLIDKYNVPVPRYTSYPTVPFWNETIEVERWKEVVKNSFSIAAKGDGISLYLHLPFCESLCTYCGCNKKITTNHQVEPEYIRAIIKEWKLYQEMMDEKPIIRELHLGGGTPTFFSPQNLHYLLTTIFQDAIIHPEHEFGFEGHPNNTTAEHLQTLYDLGFRRVSYGVQDHDPEVQRLINRIQPFENVRQAVENARRVGYTSVNFDLIYGLPGQTLETIEKTVRQSLTLRPDRIAFYSYAHVPWKSKAQRLFDESNLPPAEVKLQLYQLAKKIFTENDYFDIGMDHFALKEDDLYKAWENGTLHRNFMGYTTQHTSCLLGLGVSSISDAGNAFTQNHKTVHEYYESINAGELPVIKGYFHDNTDVDFRKYILDISCQGKTKFLERNRSELESFSFPELVKLADDGLIEWNESGLRVTPTGRNYIRNICRAFDLHLLRKEENKETAIFSRSI
jgi:oxygen-independent coproporphyrinogen-3 oxidase